MILNGIFTLINGLILMVPHIPSIAPLDYVGLGPIFSTMNYYMPVNDFFILVIAYLLLIKAKLLVRLTKWALERIVV